MEKKKIVEMKKKMDGNAKNINGKFQMIEEKLLLEKHVREARNVGLEAVEMNRKRLSKKGEFCQLHSYIVFIKMQYINSINYN